MSISDEIKNGTARQTVLRFPNGEYEDITSGFVSGSTSLTRALSENTNEVRFIGNKASKFEAEIVGDTDLSNVVINVSQLIGGYELPLFCGRVDSSKLTDTRDSRTVIAYDALYYARDINVAAWYNALPFPININDMLISLLAYAGIAPAKSLLCIQSFKVSKTIETNSLTFGTVLDAVCELCGGFGIIDSEGRYDIIYLSNEEDQIEVMSGAPLEQYDVRPIDNVIIRDNAAAVGGVVGAGTNPYCVQGNMLVYGKSDGELKDIAQVLYNSVAGYGWKPCSISMPISNPLIGCDGIRYNVTTPQGDNYKTFFLSMTLSGAQLFEQSFESFGDEYRDEAAEDTESLYTAMLISKVYNTLEADYIKAKNLESEVAKFGYVTADTFGAKYAKIDLSNVEKEYVGTLLAKVGLLSSATIEEGHVTGYLDSVKINASMIKAGTLAVDRLVLNGSNESLIFALNNVGKLTSTHTDTLDGGLITQRTITADHIVAGTITANEIAAGTITASKLNTAEIFSNSAVLNQIFAQDITATGSLTSPILKSADYAYNSGYFNSKGMIVDLKNKIIRTPNLNINGGIASKLDSILRTFGDDCSISIRPNGIDIEKDNGLGCNIAPATMSWWNADNSYQAQVGVKQWSLYSNTEIEAKNIIITAGNISIANQENASDYQNALITGRSAQFSASDASNCSVYIANSLRKAGLLVSASGITGLWDTTNQAWILYSATNQNVAIPHALSVTGAITATGALAATSVTATSGSVVAAANVYAGATSDTVTRSVYARNSLRSIRMLANASGVIGLYDETNAIFILQSSTAKSIQIGESAQATSIVLRHTNGYASFAGNGMELYGGTPYVDFHFGGSTADYTSRIIEESSGVLASIGTFRSYKNLGFGWGDAATTYAIYSKWKDGNQHNVVERNADGLSAYFGWAGSSTYPTRTILRGRNVYFDTGPVRPANDNVSSLGDGAHRFTQLFAAIGAISTSDRNQKRNIEYDLDKMDAVFDALKPCSFYHTDGDRMHFGLIAQETEKAFVGNGMNIDEIGLVCRDHIYKDGEDGAKIYLYNTDGTPQYRYGLRYEELHGLEIWQIQQLKRRVSELECKLAAMAA
ncbi:MAG: tail fiber domain-containing protein [Butyrivibrio sp.]|nr:tail fiber domain-containing protein [Butyrivibrio sp.]